MASDRQEPAIGLLTRADPEDTSEGLETSSRASDISRQQESPPEAGHHTVPRNGIPPKRLSTMTNRKPAATPNAASRPTSSSASISGTGLSKPPTRPLPSSATRRPAPGVAGGATNSSAHKKRASISSVDTKRMGDESATEEIVKASTNLSENRPIKNDMRKSTLSSASHRTSLGSSSSADKRAASTRQNHDSPVKTALRPTTNSVRPNLASSTFQGARPLASSARGTGGAGAFEARKKRLSTIPASPAPRTLDSISSGPPLSPPMSTKSLRPPLGSRKSTMSVSLEQSFREMEVVHKMLQVAMAEDCDSTDEAKEEYGKKVDESLAAIRTKLEEARRSQGFDTVDSNFEEVIETPKAAPLGVETHVFLEEINELKSGLVKSHSKVASLSAELAALESRVLQRDVNPDDALEIVTETAEKLETHQYALEKLRSQQNSKVEDLLAAHERDLEAAHIKTNEIEALHKEYTRQSLADLEAVKAEAEAMALLENGKQSQELDSRVQSLTSELAELTIQLSDERANGVSSASTIQGLQSEVSSLQQLLSETNQKNNEVVRRLDELDEQRLSILKEKEDAIVKGNDDISRLQSEIRGLEVNSAQQLEKIKSASLEKSNELEADLASAHERLSQLEVSHQEADTERRKTLDAKQEEIRVSCLVIEDLKMQMQQLHGIDEAKTELLKDHEKSALELHDKHSEEIQALTERNRSELETLGNDHQDSLLKLQTDKSDIQSSLEISEKALAAVKVQNAEASESIDVLNAKLRNLQSERDEAQAAKNSSDEALQQASNEILSLKKCLDTIGEENRNREDEHLRAIRQIKDELEATTTFLDEQKAEAKSTFEAHAAELQELRTSHAEVIGDLERSGEGKLHDLQNSFDELLKSFKQAEQDHHVELERLKVAHKQVLDQHTQAFESFRLTHHRELSELKSNAEIFQSEQLKLDSSHNEKIAETEVKHQQKIDELQRQHDEQGAELRKELEAAEKEKFEVAQQAHDTAMSELTSQLKDQKERLTHTEGQLRVTKEAHDERVSPEKLTDILQQVEDLKFQLANAHAEIDKSKDNVMILAAVLEDSKKVASDRMQHETSQLKNQHAAEISKLQKTIALENEKREKERKQGAEVRDRLAAESERMRLDLLSMNERVAQQQEAIDISATELEKANKVLETALHAAERHESNCLEAREGLKDAQAEVEELRTAGLQAEKDKVTAMNREIEKLEKAADAERERVSGLEDQLREAQMMSEKHSVRAQEVESALRLTTEKLVKLQTERLNELPATIGKENEERGPIIEGNMAGIKEQVRQLENLNEDLIEEQTRFLSRITSLPHLGPNSNLTPANGPGVDEEEEEL